MSVADPRIDQLLNALKAAGRSSPADWHCFHEFLKARKQPGHQDPPVPLILAASGESNASKHARLSIQLQWALENGCLYEALRYLEDVPVEQWNACPLEEWNQESYPQPWHWGWTSDAKPKMSAETAERLIAHLRANWNEIAGSALSEVTSPLRFEGAKRRRLLVVARSDASPPWGSWSFLGGGENRKFFTRFRAAVNAAIKPHEVDHIDFVHKSAEATP